jgi:hypothetical protein
MSRILQEAGNAVAKRNKKLFLWSFLAANLVLASFYIDIWCTPNPVSHALPVLTLTDSGTFRIDQYQNHTGDKSKVGDHYYSDKAPLPAVLAVPFYRLMQITGLAKTDANTGKKYPIYIWSAVTQADGRDYQFPTVIPVLVMGGLLFASLPFALMIFLTFAKIRGAGGSVSPVLLVMMSFYGSFIFIFSGTFFNHILTAFFLLLSYIFVKDRRYLLSGLFAGFSFACESPVAIAIPVWALLIWLNEKKIKDSVIFCLGAAPGVLFIMLFNYSVSGHPFTMINAYSADRVFQSIHSAYGFSLPTLASLWGLSFSFYMGLLPHIPALLLCAYFLVREMLNRYPMQSLFKSYLAMFAIPFFLVIASSFAWWGGWSYGPRYLMSLAVILLYEGIIYLSDKKINTLLFLLITGFGLVSTWLAKATLMYMIPDGTSQNGPAPGSGAFSNYILPQFRQGHFNSDNLLTLGFDIKASSAAYLWLVLFSGATVFFAIWYHKLYPAAVPAGKPAATARSKGKNHVKKRP